MTLVGVEIDVAGRIYLGELVLFIVTLWLLHANRGTTRNRLPTLLLVLGGLWLIGQISTDVIVDSAAQDSIRAWSKIVFAMLDLAAICLLIDSERVAAFATAGLAAGLLLSGTISPPPSAEIDPWKWAYAYPVTLLVVLGTTLPAIGKHRQLTALMLLTMAIVNVALGYRSLALTCSLVAVMLLVRTSATNDTIPDRRHAQRSRRLAFAAVLVAGLLFVQAYGLAASSGLFGSAGQRRYEVAASGTLGILVGARVEILASSQAYADSPIIGHGAYAREDRYLVLLADRLDALGYPLAIPDDGRIPTHSYLMGAAVESGILGLLFWLAILAAAGRWLWLIFESASRAAPLAIFLTTQLLWDVFFSPFNGTARITFALTAAIAMFVLESRLPRHVQGLPLPSTKRGNWT